MRVLNFLGGHLQKYTEIAFALLMLELLDCNLPMVDCEEGDKLLVVFNVLVGNFNSSLKVQNISILASLALEERL